ncbi:MAG: acyl-CoA desaturase [Gemmatimonadota bacterium]
MESENISAQTPARITFSKADPAGFAQEVRRDVNEYFSSRGLSPNANIAMVLKSVTLLSLMVVPYLLVLTTHFSTIELVGLAFVMGVGVAGVGFSVSHDALHGAYSSRPWLNTLIGCTFELVGANGYMWKITHNVIHHTYTNIQGMDEDLEVSPLLRLSPNSELHWFHRYQHFYAFATYSLSTLFWVFIKDYKYFMQRDIGPYRGRSHPPGAVAGLVIGKALYYGLAFALPLAIAPISWLQLLVGFLIVHLTAGLILGVVFQLAHVVEGTAHPIPANSGAVGNEWTVHEMDTTADFGRRSALLTWYVGGLNHQIEHHLFPKVCSVHYPRISALVQAAAARHGLAYHDHPTLWGAIHSHYLTLRSFGRDALDARKMEARAA